MAQDGGLIRMTRRRPAPAGTVCLSILGYTVAVHAIAAAGAGNLPRLTSHGC